LSGLDGDRTIMDANDPTSRRFAVVIPIGPTAIEVERAVHLLAGLLSWEPSVAWCVLVEDFPHPLGLSELKGLPGRDRIVELLNPRRGLGFGGTGGVCAGVLTAFSWIHSHTDAGFVLKIDTDALVIGPFANAVASRFARMPDVGIAGAIGNSCNPAVRPMQDLSEEPDLLKFRRLLPTARAAGLTDQHTPIVLPEVGEISLPLLTSFDAIRPHVEEAVRYGYRTSEYCQGGAYAVSRPMIDRMAAAGYLAHPEAWVHLPVGEDMAMAMYAHAVGLRLDDFSRPGEPFGIQYKALPYTLDELVSYGYGLIHSVRNDARYAEQDIRAFFRTRAAAVDRAATLAATVTETGSDLPAWRLPLSDLTYGPDEDAAVQRVLRRRWLSMGPEVEAFEREISTLLGTRHALAVANGTAALHLAFLALELKPGDEVIQPAINFVAAANMTAAVGAVPVFADIVGLDEPTIDPIAIERLITPRSRAVVVMHYGGYPCRMAEIAALCRRYRLALIEDACHALGARFTDPQGRPPDGRMAGHLGDVSCFSFFSNKNLATGEGGLVATDRDDLAARLRLLRSHGMTTLTWDRHRGHASRYDVVAHGYNYRFDEIRAALGRAQLAKLDANNRRRAELVMRYRDGLAGLPGWTIPFAQWRHSSAYHLMVAVAPDTHARDQVAAALKACGVQTSLHYPCIPDFAAFEPAPSHDLPLSRAFATRVLTLPLHPGLTFPQVEEICARVRTVVTRHPVSSR
jgi:dTDP-4-amino-4,6-dideoxygalactose transaminase